MKRAFVVVIDACGAGALPDAAEYGDAGANTLGHLAEAVGGLRLPVMQELGLGSILALRGCPPARRPALHGRLHPLGHGKDSTAGHRELMGLPATHAPPTFPNGLDPQTLQAVEDAIGLSVICNSAYNGIAAIEDFGEAHLQSGRPILYTSQDSVVQLAAHVEVLAPEELYAACKRVRSLLADVGRVIARPFEGVPGGFARTLGRRDFALAPDGATWLDRIAAPVHAVGKVNDLFDGRGIDHAHPGATNAAALAQTGELIESLEGGLVFTNLIETDQRFGHRKDVNGFHGSLREIDAALGGWLGAMGTGDLLILCADHGCDPAAAHTDHTREYVPLLARFAGDGGRRHDGPMADVGASVTAWLGGTSGRGLPGESFVA
ncbi:MAG: phosphopentomutase [Solirubrobacteraceae bacterium]